MRMLPIGRDGLGWRLSEQGRRGRLAAARPAPVGGTEGGHGRQGLGRGRKGRVQAEAPAGVSDAAGLHRPPDRVRPVLLHWLYSDLGCVLLAAHAADERHHLGVCRDR